MSEMNVKVHPAFSLKRSHQIETLKLTVYEFEHNKTGAMHYHLAAPHKENVFMVALRTVPMNSKGVAHILEHTVLCGSEKYPVRDPFFLMIRRSLNTFMNAFTSSDYTAFPFASQNAKDFGNLLDIYLDAVFFSRLDPLDFLQEGHRIEFEEVNNPESDLVYRGVVFNEMKGDSSSVISVLYDQVKKHLFPTTTYHYNSGGDPLYIPELSYEELLDFYKSHYHPSNAIFMTFGDMSAFDLQSEFENKALARFERSNHRIEVGTEERIEKTLRIVEPYAVDDADSLSKNTHIVMAWLLGENTDLDLLLKCNLLSDVLLDTAASPLRHALENTSLGGAPSPLCGIEETNKEMSFMCGIEGSEIESADEFEKLVLSTLEKVAKDGVPKEKLDACLHQLELNQREIGGDGQPFGLQVIFSCMSAAIHRGDPIKLLDIDPVLENLRREIEEPDFISKLVQELLLDNKHCVRLCLYPDENLNKKNLQSEKERLATIKENLSQPEIENIIGLSKDLQDRQDRTEDLDCLPKVGLSDIPLTFSVPKGKVEKLGNGPKLTRYDAATNGIIYHQIVCDMPELEAVELQRLPIYTQIVSEIGSRERSYLETQHIQHSISGGIGAYSAIRGMVSEPNRLQAHLTFSSRSLNRNAGQMMDILKDTFESPNFSEGARVRDLVKQSAIRRVSSISNNGHGLAMSAAASHFRPISRLSYHLSGLEGIKKLKQLDKDLDHPDELSALLASLQDIQLSMVKMPVELLLVGETKFNPKAIDLLQQKWSTGGAKGHGSILSVPFEAPPRDQAWVTTTQVNFCASAFATVAEDHPDSAALSILSGVLRNGYLHKAIREQGGAYGGGASHDASNGLFRFYSYRDPNLMATFEAFEEAVQWVIKSDISFDLIEEAILGIISSIDAPGSPSGDARQAFHNNLFGRDGAHRERLRRNILGVKVEDIKRVAHDYLLASCARAIVLSEARLAEIPKSFVTQQI